ncbi:Nucleoporin 153kDa [Seminavis robusta]|uniref:Nuclear pore complex protein Nup153 n=1 Tax=Seminavis robusta TaxID=568900 RepID=A0A9N8H3F4_9STRA|nr:Nucleoporin 153kDa [Seminavis robusta]|eukprot:Sro59_g034140.1 Nucleoporin 153kDa (1867) ;mRNA; r:55530-61130
MADFAEELRLKPLDAPLEGTSLLRRSIRPTCAGLKVLAVPAETVGIAYRVNGTALESLVLTGDSIQVQFSLDLSVPVVNIAASSDGRLVAVACIDGSLQCFNATQSGFSKRWSLSQVHDHVVDDVSQSPSASRANSAAAAGPVRSLSFAPQGYNLILVNNSDKQSTLKLFNAAESSPNDLLRQKLPADLQVASASWSGTNDALAIGDTSGVIHIYKISAGYALQPITTMPFLGEDDEGGWSCTHLDWFNNGGTLAAGYCRVIPEEDDDDEEDCSADHEAIFFLMDMDASSLQPTKSTEVGDVVAFFSVPKHGRHVYFTSDCTTQQAGVSFFVVASNVGSDIALLIKVGADEWEIYEFPDGSNPTTPTDDEDEFMYPMGVGTLTAPGTGQKCLLVAATDGSLSTSLFSHEQDANFFIMPSSAATVLPNAPVPEESSALSSETEPKLNDEPPAASSAASGGFAFGSPAPAPAFGSGFSFGGGTTANASFGAPAFGSPSTLGGTRSFGFGSPPPPAAPTTKESSPPAQTSGSVFGAAASGTSTFGASMSSGGGFAALAKSPSSGFGSKSETSGETFSGFGAAASTGSSVFGAGPTAPGGGSPYAPPSNNAFGGFGGPRTTFSRPNDDDDSASEASSKSDEDSEAEKEDTATNSASKATSTFGGLGAGTSFGSGSAMPSFGSSFAISSQPAGAQEKPSPFAAFGGSGTTFGSGAAFGAGSSVPAITPGTSFSFGAAKPANEQPSQFNIFGKKNDGPSHTLMAKPLFGSSPPTKTQQPTAPEPKSPRNNMAAPVATVEKDASPEGPVAKKAAGVFDSFDSHKQGSLPVSSFEDLIDELGEGFHGEEMDKQSKLIDPSGSGMLERSAFIKWYQALVENAGDDDDDESNDDSEIEEEKEKAHKAFMSLATKENGEDIVSFSQLEKLFSALGSTYCKEDHGVKLKKLVSEPGKLRLDEFVSFYIDWMFGDDDGSIAGSEEEGGDQEQPASGSAPAAVSPPKGTWGDAFKNVLDKNSWKCDVCMVQNNQDATQCMSCEAPRPGYENAAKKDDVSSSAAGSAIGAGGFTFGGGSAPAASGAISSGGFTFGAPAAGTSSSAGGGFTFGAPPSSASLGKESKPSTFGFTAQASAEASSSGGFTFGGVKVPSGSAAASSGFEFQPDKPTPSLHKEGSTTPSESIKHKSTNDQAKPIPPSLDNEHAKKAAGVFDSFDSHNQGSLPVSSFEDLIDELGEGFHGEEMDKQSKLIDPSGSGMLERSAFIKWYQALVENAGDDVDDESNDDSEIEEEKEKAHKAFMALATKENGEDIVSFSQLEKLFSALGSTYCKEDHGVKLKKLVSEPGKLRLDEFVSFYIDWMFGDDDGSIAGSEEEGGDQEQPASGSAPAAVSPPKGTWGDAFKNVLDKNSWKCDVCMVQNNQDATQCMSCEAPRPGYENAAKKDDASSSAAGSAIGAGGFTFGGGSAPAASGAISSGGFTFGAPAAGTSSSAGGGFSFGAPAPTTGFTFDAKATPGGSKGAGFTFGTTEVKTPDSQKSDSVSKAPTTKQGADKGSKPASSSGSSAFPPMSTKAPTPFGATATKTSSSVGSSAFPPMSSKAPTPFGAGGSGKVSSSAGSSAFPPMSTKAPTPFGASASPAPAQPASSFGSSAFPPMSSKAPTPFGAPATKAPTPFGASPAPAQPASSFGSSAFPPMSSKAPTPFGAPATKPASSGGSSAFPPMSAKVPTPFGAPATTKPASSSGSSAFPPMSSKAPTPFGASASKPASSGGSSAFPPMSAKAPTPFGAPATTKPAILLEQCLSPMSTKAHTLLELLPPPSQLVLLVGVLSHQCLPRRPHPLEQQHLPSQQLLLAAVLSRQCQPKLRHPLELLPHQASSSW